MVPETLYKSNQPTSAREEEGDQPGEGGRELSIHKVEILVELDTRKEMIIWGGEEETVSLCCSVQEHCFLLSHPHTFSF